MPNKAFSKLDVWKMAVKIDFVMGKNEQQTNYITLWSTNGKLECSLALIKSKSISKKLSNEDGFQRRREKKEKQLELIWINCETGITVFNLLSPELSATRNVGNGKTKKSDPNVVNFSTRFFEK